MLTFSQHIEEEKEKCEFDKANDHRASPAFKGIVKQFKLKPYYEMGDRKTVDHHVHPKDHEGVKSALKAAKIPHSMSSNYGYGHRLTINGVERVYKNQGDD